LLGRVEEVKPCEVSSVVVTACDLAFVAHNAARHSMISRLMLLRIVGDTRIVGDADRNLFQVFIKMSPKKNCRIKDSGISQKN
jgi:hypothetical protein